MEKATEILGLVTCSPVAVLFPTWKKKYNGCLSWPQYAHRSILRSYLALPVPCPQ
jgi:hypothetical protein